MARILVITIIKRWMGLGFLAVSPLFCFAAATESSQQALQQLRLLQQRFGQPNHGPTPSPSKQGALQALSPQEPAPHAPQDEAAPTVSPISQDEIIQREAFRTLKRQLFPLSIDEIKQLHKTHDEQLRTQTASSGTPPKPTASSQFVNLSPGSTPPVIRLAQGFVSSLVFLDSTGAPWPLTAYDLGDSTAFNIQWDHVGNTIMIQALKLYTYGNLAVRLKGLNTPVMLTLIPGQKVVDYRVDLRIQGHGPNAKGLVMETGLPDQANNVLLHILDGVPPDGSQRLVVNGGDALAWLFNNKMYVRTNLTILSPGWVASMTSADGTHAYEMMKAPVLLVSWHGKVMQLIVEGL